MTGRRFNPVALIAAVLRPLDPVLCLLLALLLGAAWVLMTSASPERLPAMQMHVGVALTLMWIVAAIPTKRLLQAALPLYLGGVVLLLGVLFFGESSKGAQRWLDLGVVRIQPSELMKIAVPLMLAWYFQLREDAVRFHDFVVGGLLLAIPLGLIVVQPDLGTSLLVAAAGVYVLFFAGLSWKLIVPVAFVALAGIVAIVGFGDQICQPGVDWQVLREYQKQRVCTLLDPTQDPLGRGFHTIQSTIAIGSGGLWGKGWMEGTQTHLAFIPERHTDFIFAVLGEEFGLVGALALIVTYLLFLLRGLFIAARGATLGARLLAGAVTMMVFTYAFVNIGMVSGILPVVGVPLPFLSYGGTALVTLCIGVGMLMSVARSRNVAKD
ncbi:rod shape-determining protein RodA [Pseudazoarcus pumilus]|uniref:Peptidoglycan glycosyltransferase MrdB n=1 Tax=Pseudazoarcus pumilus TaxID=2067960 RepID=A0A2I6SA94_9RHOO|nr:rod shape-determining protein RodA [Pseudazoarcus pumilus]AUN96172.1 rod shape-determining protein RodA [Pseudazoarcus pumilus]